MPEPSHSEPPRPAPRARRRRNQAPPTIPRREYRPDVKAFLGRRHDTGWAARRPRSG